MISWSFKLRHKFYFLWINEVYKKKQRSTDQNMCSLLVFAAYPVTRPRDYGVIGVFIRWKWMGLLGHSRIGAIFLLLSSKLWERGKRWGRERIACSREGEERSSTLFCLVGILVRLRTGTNMGRSTSSSRTV